MKKLLTLILITTYSFAFAQKIDTIPFKGAYKIIIENNDTAGQNFKAVGQGLVDQDLGIGSKDSEFGQIISAPFKTKDIYYIGKGHSVIIAKIKDKLITLYSQYNPNETTKIVSFSESQSTYSPVKYTKGISREQIIFEVMNKFAKSLPHTKLTYSE